MKSKDQTLLEEAYSQVLNNRNGSQSDKQIAREEANSLKLVNESEMSNEITDCHDIIKKLARGKFGNESDEILNRIKKCKSIFSVTRSGAGYDVIIKDSALPVIEDLYPSLIGKFKSAADCKKDIAKCRKDKLK